VLYYRFILTTLLYCVNCMPLYDRWCFNANQDSCIQ